MAYPKPHIDIAIPHGPRDHVIAPGIVKLTFNLDIESKVKTRSIVNNVSRALVKKKLLMLGSNETDAINNPDIYDTQDQISRTFN